MTLIPVSCSSPPAPPPPKTHSYKMNLIIATRVLRGQLHPVLATCWIHRKKNCVPSQRLANILGTKVRLPQMNAYEFIQLVEVSEKNYNNEGNDTNKNQYDTYWCHFSCKRILMGNVVIQTLAGTVWDFCESSFYFFFSSISNKNWLVSRITAFHWLFL